MLQLRQELFVFKPGHIQSFIMQNLDQFVQQSCLMLDFKINSEDEFPAFCFYYWTWKGAVGKFTQNNILSSSPWRAA